MFEKINSFIKSLGPGLLFAGAAIGVSHLVQSTRAGADYGFGLLWALLIVNFFKYPFMQFGPRYALATGESLIEGYQRLGKPVLLTYFLLTFLNMFTIQAAVTIVTAGLAAQLFGSEIPATEWAIYITIVSFLILFFGRYKLLDNLMKLIVLVLTVSSIIAVILASQNFQSNIDFHQTLPKGAVEVAFLITFLGWMPAPLDVSVWQSLWTVEKQKGNSEFVGKRAFFDFNIGYIATVFLGICFMALGALVMFGTGESFGNGASDFAKQLIKLYTDNLGETSATFIGIAAFTTMFSTTLTTLDASPRSMARATEIYFDRTMPKSYLFWIVLLSLGTILIMLFFLSSMVMMVKIATIFSFLTAPFYAICNFILIRGKYTPENYRPSKFLKVWSIFGIAFLVIFCFWYLGTFF